MHPLVCIIDDTGSKHIINSVNARNINVVKHCSQSITDNYICKSDKLGDAYKLNGLPSWWAYANDLSLIVHLKLRSINIEFYF